MRWWFSRGEDLGSSCFGLRVVGMRGFPKFGGGGGGGYLIAVLFIKESYYQYLGVSMLRVPIFVNPRVGLVGLGLRLGLGS